MKALVAPIAVMAALALAEPATAGELRVCADPNNMPFSNDRGEGFENRIVELVARDMGATVRYVWWAQRRGYIRQALTAGLCDLVPGVASGMDALATTRPYYRSSYVFVWRADRNLDLASLDDPRLKTLTIGVQMIGDDFSNTPPAHALAERGVVGNVRGYMLYGDYGAANPQETIIRAVANGEVDTAVVWGPLAGYFASREDQALKIAPVPNAGAWPMGFSISMGVRKGDRSLRDAVDKALTDQSQAIQAVLTAFGVPR